MTKSTKSKPIIFNSEMVNAVLKGRKTQTRRIIKFKGSNPECYGTRDDGAFYFGGDPINQDPESVKCPFGKIGDRLWVKETFKGWSGGVVYKLDALKLGDVRGKWTPSVHMPKWASRITLEITNIRVERLQDISEEDALAEGIEERTWLGGFGWRYKNYENDSLPIYKRKNCFGNAKESFASLWQSTKGKDSWDQNPFVWVIEFKKGVEND